MDFINLNTEYENIQKFSKQGTNTVIYFIYKKLINLGSFFKTLHRHSEILCINSKKSLDNVYSEMIKNDTKSSLSKNFFEFYRNFETYFEKLKGILNHFESDIIEPLNFFNQHLNGKNSEFLNDFKNVNKN